MKVILAHDVHLKLKYYVDNINAEISGLGLVERINKNDLYVSDIYLLEQTVSGASTVLDPEAVGKFAAAKLSEENFPVEKIKLWWHSHVCMDTFWSETDTSTIDGLDNEQEEDNWYLSIVCNQYEQRRARLDIYKPFRVVCDNLEIVIGENNALEEQIKKEIEEKVKNYQYNIKKAIGNDRYNWTRRNYQHDPLGLPEKNEKKTIYGPQGDPITHRHNARCDDANDGVSPTDRQFAQNVINNLSKKKKKKKRKH